jgi:hypothetical protein
VLALLAFEEVSMRGCFWRGAVAGEEGICDVFERLFLFGLSSSIVVWCVGSGITIIF